MSVKIKVRLANTLGLVLVAWLSVTSLSGCVPLIAGGALATGDMIADRRSSGIYIEDQNIELKAEQTVNKALGEKVHINATSFNMQVLITGEVPDAASKAKVEDLVRDVANVKNVVNELVIDSHSTLSQRNNDAYLTTKVKARMIKENRFPANVVKVTTEATTVFLMGIVTRQEADAAVEIARTTEGVRKVVKVFEYIDRAK